MIGDMKEIIKNAILDGEIPNEYDAAYALMERLAAEPGADPRPEIRRTPRGSPFGSGSIRPGCSETLFFRGAEGTAAVAGEGLIAAFQAVGVELRPGFRLGYQPYPREDAQRGSRPWVNPEGVRVRSPR